MLARPATPFQWSEETTSSQDVRSRAASPLVAPHRIRPVAQNESAPFADAHWREGLALVLETCTADQGYRNPRK